MTPNLKSGDLVVVRKCYVEYKPGDIVFFHHELSGLKFIKRLIALEKMKVHVDNYRVYVNDALYSESKIGPPSWDYDLYDCRYSRNFYTQKGEVFLLGDNRCLSVDSRHFGAIKQNMLLGKVIYRLPINFGNNFND